MDLMDMVKGAVTKQVMGQIGGLLGTDENKTSSAFETAAGSILGGLIKKAGTEQGARDVFDMASKQDAGVLDKLGDILGGGQADEQYVNSGNGILDGVFGNDRGGILGTIAKFLGLDSGIVGKLLPMLAPIVMGVIGKHIKNKALDAVGLGSFLGEQKKSLGFMPSSLTDGLGFGNLLSGVSDSVGGAVDAVGGAGKAAVGAVGDAGKAAAGAAGDAAEAGGNILKLLLPLVALAVLAFLAWKFMFSGGGTTNEGKAPVTRSLEDDGGIVSGSTASLNLEIPEGVDFGDFGVKGIAGLGGKLAGITDGFKDVSMDSAGGLADKIKDLTGSIDGMGLANLPESGKGFVGEMIGKFIKSVTGSMEGLDEGILGILKPVVTALMEKLNPLVG